MVEGYWIGVLFFPQNAITLEQYTSTVKHLLVVMAAVGAYVVQTDKRHVTTVLVVCMSMFCFIIILQNQ